MKGDVMGGNELLWVFICLCMREGIQGYSVHGRKDKDVMSCSSLLSSLTLLVSPNDQIEPRKMGYF